VKIAAFLPLVAPGSANDAAPGGSDSHLDDPRGIQFMDLLAHWFIIPRFW